DYYCCTWHGSSKTQIF
nr:immunoglobulin light chain junction region [Macaca mulatta]MOV69821.1 immunoglobulin light chain junction region [Macaca mulatta]MOV70159.1 immunoglobulin light chain junction region [Macaca mulatta]MOV71753.1 immunoglobulin light chain junction region [Macaca mulatta]